VATHIGATVSSMSEDVFRGRKLVLTWSGTVRERRREGKLRLTCWKSWHRVTVTPSPPPEGLPLRVAFFAGACRTVRMRPLRRPPHDSARRDIGSVPWHPLIGDADRVSFWNVRNPPRPCEKAMFKSLCGSGP